MNIVPTKLRFFHDRGIKIRGVIHVGMSWGEEIADYLDMGATHVIGFEPVPEAYDEAVKLYGNDPRVILSNVALGHHTQDATLRKVVDPNPMPGHPVGTGGSSFFKEVHGLPEGVTVQPIDATMLRFDEWAKSTKINMEDYNALVIDVQGMESEVLVGFGDLLKYIQVANIECSREPVYKGEVPAAELVAQMNRAGFQAVTPIEDHNDILFQR